MAMTRNAMGDLAQKSWSANFCSVAWQALSLPLSLGQGRALSCLACGRPAITTPILDGDVGGFGWDKNTLVLI